MGQNIAWDCNFYNMKVTKGYIVLKWSNFHKRPFHLRGKIIKNNKNNQCLHQLGLHIHISDESFSEFPPFWRYITTLKKIPKHHHRLNAEGTGLARYCHLVFSLSTQHALLLGETIGCRSAVACGAAVCTTLPGTLGCYVPLAPVSPLAGLTHSCWVY